MNNVKVGVALVDGAKMRKLNKKYRDLDKAVKVLAFPFDEPQPNGVYFLGEIVVNKDQVSNKEELLALINHGAKNLLKEYKHL